MWLWRNVSTVDAYGLGQGRNLGCGHPFAPQRGHGAVRVQHAGSIKTATAPRCRGSYNCTTARVLRPRCSRRHLSVGQGADVSVAQPVIDEGEQLAGRGDLGDVTASAGLDPFAITGDFGGVGLALNGLDGRPPHQFAALLGDVSAPHDFV